MSVRPRILVFGGAGVFGGKLARRLIAQGSAEVVVIGRDASRLEAFRNAHGGEVQVLDRESADLEARLGLMHAEIVIDAAGPFQAYGADPYRLARAALAAGAHYLDLSDDAAFTAGIVALDDAARTAGRAALSGVSSVPALSAAAVHALRAGLATVERIDTVILPGNRAPRGLSVVQAILAQAGRPLKIWRDGAVAQRCAWTSVQRVTLEVPGIASLRRRWASWIGAPDLALFGPHFGARDVRFRAGLELSILHLGLTALAWLPRLGLMRSLVPLARPLRFVADRLHAFGSDRGGMRVRVVGRDTGGVPRQRDWTLIAEAGDGPEIPAVPAFVLVHKLLRGEVTSGARPALDELALEELETSLADFAIRMARVEKVPAPLYFRVMGATDWSTLAEPLRRLHAPIGRARHAGRASIERGPHPLAGLAASLMRFPPAAADVAVTVTIAERNGCERWLRQFGTSRFHSTLSESHLPGHAVERFGPMRVHMRLPPRDGGLSMEIERVTWAGIPLPRSLWPSTTAIESVDGQGRFRFDVQIGLPWIGPLVRYRGWLQPVH